MPAAWIAAGSAVLGAVNSGSSSGGGGGGGQVAQGAANIAGGALSANEAQQFGNQLAQTANPFGQYNQQFAGQLAATANQGSYGSPYNVNQTDTSNYANNTSNNQFGQQVSNFAQGANATLNPVVGGVQSYTQQGQQGLNSLNLGGINSQINGLLQDPSSIYNTAQYKAAFGQGSQAVNSTLAAQGLNASGNQLAALQSYGQQFGENAYNTQLSQLSGLSGQAASQQQQGYGQQLSTAQLGLQSQNQIYNQLAGAAGINMQANQQGFNQLQSANQSGMQQNNQGFNQMAQLSGLSSGSPTAAAAAQAQVYGNVNSAYGSVGQGIGQLASGAGNILNGLGSGSSTTTGVNSAGFVSGLGTSTSGSDITGSGSLYGTSAGMSGTDYTYNGAGNTWGF